MMPARHLLSAVFVLLSCPTIMAAKIVHRLQDGEPFAFTLSDQTPNISFAFNLSAPTAVLQTELIGISLITTEISATVALNGTQKNTLLVGTTPQSYGVQNCQAMPGLWRVDVQLGASSSDAPITEQNLTITMSTDKPLKLSQSTPSVTASLPTADGAVVHVEADITGEAAPNDGAFLKMTTEQPAFAEIFVDSLACDGTNGTLVSLEPDFPTYFSTCPSALTGGVTVNALVARPVPVNGSVPAPVGDNFTVTLQRYSLTLTKDTWNRNNPLGVNQGLWHHINVAGAAGGACQNISVTVQSTRFLTAVRLYSADCKLALVRDEQSMATVYQVEHCAPPGDYYVKTVGLVEGTTFDLIYTDAPDKDQCGFTGCGRAQHAGACVATATTPQCVCEQAIGGTNCDQVQTSKLLQIHNTSTTSLTVPAGEAQYFVMSSLAFATLDLVLTKPGSADTNVSYYLALSHAAGGGIPPTPTQFDRVVPSMAPLLSLCPWDVSGSVNNAGVFGRLSSLDGMESLQVDLKAVFGVPPLQRLAPGVTEAISAPQKQIEAEFSSCAPLQNNIWASVEPCVGTGSLFFTYEDQAAGTEPATGTVSQPYALFDAKLPLKGAKSKLRPFETINWKVSVDISNTAKETSASARFSVSLSDPAGLRPVLPDTADRYVLEDDTLKWQRAGPPPSRKGVKLQYRVYRTDSQPSKEALLEHTATAISMSTACGLANAIPLTAWSDFSSVGVGEPLTFELSKVTLLKKRWYGLGVAVRSGNESAVAYTVQGAQPGSFVVYSPGAVSPNTGSGGGGGNKTGLILGLLAAVIIVGVAGVLYWRHKKKRGSDSEGRYLLSGTDLQPIMDT